MHLTDMTALTALIEPVVQNLGFALVRVRLAGGKDLVLQVMAERPADGQLDIDECATISRALSELLDEADPIEEAYRLEVSSPGIDRPLTRLSDYARWQGFAARLAFKQPFAGRKRLEGRLRGVNGGHILFDDALRQRHEIDFGLIDHGKLVITDDLLAATRPQTVEIGADRMVRPATAH
jgi:ribosome maturation factor RimP